MLEYLFFHVHKQRVLLQSLNTFWRRLFKKVLSTWNFKYVFQVQIAKYDNVSLIEISLKFTHAFVFPKPIFIGQDRCN